MGIILWAGYWAVDRDMEKVFKTYSDMGVKGFKVDFMDRDDQTMVDFYYRCAETAAKHHLMIDYHGAYKPTGLHAHTPMINFEGVYGLEQLKMVSFIGRYGNLRRNYALYSDAGGAVGLYAGSHEKRHQRKLPPDQQRPMSQGTVAANWLNT